MLKEIKVSLFIFSLIGILYTTYGTFFDENNYTLEQKLLRTLIFILFFILGPLILYYFFKFMENKSKIR
jgi:hypothetical protein